jgi:hypothetical protein
VQTYGQIQIYIDKIHNICNIENGDVEQNGVNSRSERNVLLKGDKHEEGEEWALWMTQWTEALIFVCTFLSASLVLH